MNETSSTATRDLVARLLDDQRDHWQRGERRPVEEYLRAWPALADDAEAVLDLIYHERKLDQERGTAAAVEEYLGRFPHLRAELRDLFDVDALLDPTELLGLRRAERGEAEVPAIPGCEVRERLGRGGMGVAYRAWQPSLKRDVVIKILDAAGPGTADAERRLRAEAEAIARLQHPHIVQIYEVGDCQGRPYLVLEYMAGGSLDRRLAGTPRPAMEAATLLETLAHAVHSAHEKGVIHRDLKPSNILLTADGLPKISDFGLAKLLGAAASGVSAPGSVVGTPSYMPPEQAQGQPSVVGPEADVYSLGAILYEALTGRPPFRADSPLATLQQVMTAEPAPPRRLNSAVPSDLETICLKCLDKDPRKRYASAHELADDLHRFLTGNPICARPVGAWGVAARWARRQPLTASLAALSAITLAALMIVGLCYVWHFRRTAEDLAQKNRETEAALHRADAAVDGSLDALDQLLFAERFRGRGPSSTYKERQFFHDMVALYERCLDENPDSVKVRERVARVLDRIGFLHYRLGQDDKAEELLIRSVAMHRQLVVEFPDEPRRKHDLSGALQSLAVLRSDGPRPGEAEKIYDEARATEEDLLQAHPDEPVYQEGVARRYIGLGDLFLWKLKAPGQAVSCFAKALGPLEKAAKASPARADLHAVLGWTIEKYANALQRSGGDVAEVRRLFAQAIRELHASFAEGAGRSPTYQKILCDAHKNLANEWVKAGDHAKAAEVLTALGNLDFHFAPSYSYEASRSFVGCARLAGSDSDLARRYELRAVIALERAMRDGYKNLGRLRADLAKRRADKITALPAYDAALRTAVEECEKKPDRPGRW
jgi:tetratricopeptide (TPR) repeat protein